MVSKTFNIFNIFNFNISAVSCTFIKHRQTLIKIFNISAVSSMKKKKDAGSRTLSTLKITILTFQQFRAYFERKTLKIAEMLNMLI